MAKDKDETPVDRTGMANPGEDFDIEKLHERLCLTR